MLEKWTYKNRRIAHDFKDVSQYTQICHLHGSCDVRAIVNRLIEKRETQHERRTQLTGWPCHDAESLVAVAYHC